MTRWQAWARSAGAYEARASTSGQAGEHADQWAWMTLAGRCRCKARWWLRWLPWIRQ